MLQDQAAGKVFMTHTNQHTSSLGKTLAVLGGAPCFSEDKHVGRPNIGDTEALHTALADILSRRWLTNNGPVVQAFEQRIADLLDVKHCISVCNATIGLQLLIRALELEGEVMVPSFTFPATVQALAWCGLTPVFCDVDWERHLIDPQKIEPLIGQDTVAIMGVHLWGNGCDVNAIDDIAGRHGLKVMYDAAHAFHCSHQGRLFGGFGEAEVFSFHATKFVNCFEGGVVTTNNGDLAQRLRLTRNFGFEAGEVQCLGTNAKMSEISAAMGMISLDAMDRFTQVNQAHRERYERHLGPVPGIAMTPIVTGERQNYQYVVINVDEDESGLSRDTLMTVLQAERVLARRYFHPGCHRIPPFDKRGYKGSDQLEVTDALCDQVLVLPTGTGVSSEDVDKICEVICIAVDRSEQVIQAVKGV